MSEPLSGRLNIKRARGPEGSAPLRKILRPQNGQFFSADNEHGPDAPKRADHRHGLGGRHGHAGSGQRVGFHCRRGDDGGRECGCFNRMACQGRYRVAYAPTGEGAVVSVVSRGSDTAVGQGYGCQFAVDYAVAAFDRASIIICQGSPRRFVPARAISPPISTI